MTPSDNFCYRHPDRESYVLCQRCTRTICGECQTQAPVGVICPECMGADRRAAREAPWSPRSRRRAGRLQAVAQSTPLVTYTVMTLCAIVYALQWITQQANSPVIDWYGTYSPAYTDLQHGVFEPWRMLTSVFLHASILHLAMNMLTLWLFGRTLEPMFGRLRFALLLLVSGLGGSLMVSILSPNTFVVGASGAVFGLIGAWFVVMRRLRMDVRPMLVLIGINVVVSLMNPGISWEAHLGGALFGAASAALLLRDHERRRGPAVATWAMVALSALCVALPPVIGILFR